MGIGEIGRPNELVDQDLVYSRGSHTKPVTMAFGDPDGWLLPMEVGGATFSPQEVGDHEH